MKTVTHIQGPDTEKAFDLLPHECLFVRNDQHIHAMLTTPELGEWITQVTGLHIEYAGMPYQEKMDTWDWCCKLQLPSHVA